MQTPRPSLSPVRIGTCEIPNRIFRPAHEVMLAEQGLIGDAFIAYHEARARGGAGLIILEASAVHPSSGSNPKVLRVWDDKAIPGLTRLGEALGRHGTRGFVQLWHGGHHAVPLDGGPPWSSSHLPGPTLGIPAQVMDESQIAEIIAAFAASAVRVRDAGLHGIELHAAHGYLLRQFLARATNPRTDRWGGSFENRARFILEVMRAIRAAVGTDIACGIRLGPEPLEGLSDMAEIAALVALLEAERLVDFVSLSPGDYITAPGLIAAGMEAPAGYQLPLFDDLAERTKLPLIVTGRFRSLDEADAVLREGRYQMVGMVRAMIADPDLVAKTMAGEEDRIRPCIGCNQLCTAGVPAKNVKCVVNVEACRELDFEARRAAPVGRRVAIIGGGVAGLEAARRAAIDGHRVTLYEARPELGGQVRLAGRLAPRMASFGDIAHWLEGEVRRLGVEVHTSSYIDGEDFDPVSADHVIVATGALEPSTFTQRWDPGLAVEIAADATITSPLDALNLKREAIPADVLIFDEIGHYEGVALAEKFVLAGATITYATPLQYFGQKAAMTGRTLAAQARLRPTGRFEVITNAVVTAVDRNSVTVFNERVDPAPRRVAASLLVPITYRIPDQALVDRLRARGCDVQAIGDARTPRFVEAAFLDAWRAVDSIGR